MKSLEAQFKRDLENQTDYRSTNTKMVDVAMASPVFARANFVSFGLLISDAKFPLIIDRIYPLEHCNHGINYFLHNKETVLGENIGILINKEDDFEWDDETTIWNPVQLDDIEYYNHSYSKREKDIHIDQQNVIENQDKNENVEHQETAKTL